MPGDNFFFAFFNETKNTVNIGTSIAQIRPGYPVGQELINFLYLDLQTYENRRILLFDYFGGNNTVDKKKAKDKIVEIYNSSTKFAKRVFSVKRPEDIVEHGDLAEFLLNAIDMPENVLERHPYFTFCFGEERDLMDEFGLDLLYYQKYFKEAIQFCFDQSFNPLLNQLTAEERYYLWIQRNTNRHNMLLFEPSNINSRSNTIYISSNNQNAELLFDIKFDDITQDLINKVKLASPIPVQITYCSNPVEYAFFEFSTLIKINAKMKECKNCGKYFILKGDYATDYCDRIPDNQKMTCKKIAATMTRKSKLQRSPILKEYEKAYKRMYARQSSHKISAEDFRLWVEAASSKRDLTVAEYNQTPSEGIIQQFKEYLGNK